MILPALNRLQWTVLVGLTVAGTLWLAYGRMQSPVASAVADVDDFCVVAPPTPYDPKSGLSLHAPRPVPVDARCPVCGMFPARSPDWAAQVIFSNGDAQFFDSPLTLFVYLQDVNRYSVGRHASEIAASYVNDADRGGWILAINAFYVYSSNALGPMRAGNLPAFSSAAGAQRFASVRGGTVLQTSEIKSQLLRNMMGARHHAHAEKASQ